MAQTLVPQFLLNRSRTQEEIAQVVGISFQRVAQIVTFSNWVVWFEISTAVEKCDLALYRVKEATFRKFWAKRKDAIGKEKYQGA